MNLFRLFYSSSMIFLWLISFNSSIAIEAPRVDRETPRGRARGGASRPHTSCVETDIPLTAIFGNNTNDHTHQAQPQFLFYIPYGASNISQMEFTLLDESGRIEIYETQINLLDDSGIIKLSLADAPDVSLAPNTLYKWYFKLYCQGNLSYEADYVVNGWVQHVEVQDDIPIEWYEQYEFHRDSGLWYDAISIVAESYIQDQQSFAVNSAWIDILELLDYQELIDQSFVEFEQIESH